MATLFQHGRLKIKTTAQQKAEKELKQSNQLTQYKASMSQILLHRNCDPFDPVSFKICAGLLSTNPDIYTLWNYRKEVILREKHRYEESDPAAKEDGDVDLKAFDGLLEKEISLTEDCLRANPKSYSAWYHRYWVLMLHSQPNWQQEFALCTKYLSVDDRNFHCWDYRRQLVNRIGITLPVEIKFSTERINNNFSNYSSWHYRSTLIQLNEQCIEEELELVKNAVFTDPGDSSAWFYLKWVVTNPALGKETCQELLDTLEQLQELEPDCKWVLLAKGWLMKRLHVKDYAVELYTQLIHLDAMRKGLYRDLLQNCIENS
ncbi:hypothetical protein HUJ04_005586 [Dendroctonus ponderosae]|nr:hypothetical protein HUJ04_005586 [Dendroctonus ponderosae]KAH1001589.1 hypothetical protein HUJ04_005586 [Dendroctonus ponderosae]KAH1001590.1 hypothetical protein HUJ04_005586 [Dendroctonus ponderosae]